MRSSAVPSTMRATSSSRAPRTTHAASGRLPLQPLRYTCRPDCSEQRMAHIRLKIFHHPCSAACTCSTIPKVVGKGVPFTPFKLPPLGRAACYSCSCVSHLSAVCKRSMHSALVIISGSSCTPTLSSDTLVLMHVSPIYWLLMVHDLSPALNFDSKELVSHVLSLAAPARASSSKQGHHRNVVT
eukprot:1140355-Pelagomonas_calceolata.AAC.1